MDEVRARGSGRQQQSKAGTGQLAAAHLLLLESLWRRYLESSNYIFSWGEICLICRTLQFLLQVSISQELRGIRQKLRLAEANNKIPLCKNLHLQPCAGENSILPHICSDKQVCRVEAEEGRMEREILPPPATSPHFPQRNQAGNVVRSNANLTKNKCPAAKIPSQNKQ